MTADRIAVDIDHFCSGHLVVDKDRTILFCNAYICQLSGCESDKIIGKSIGECLTKASNIFIDSYIFPQLLTHSLVEENQINWLNKQGQSIPVITHIKLADSGISYWSLYVSANRDKLQTELVNARGALEKQTKELFSLATTDPLTGLMNRRELSNLAEKTNSQMARSDASYAVMSVDIDFFKKVNDTYGHHTGDEALKGLAKLLTADRRSNDIVARTGGEEFVLVLPDIDIDDALRIAETLRVKAEELTIGEMKLTVSIGVAVSIKGQNAGFERLLRLSDNALFQSKHDGRNKVSLAKQ
jgi:diguanylate cyclase (GGDEF)-like protein